MYSTILHFVSLTSVSLLLNCNTEVYKWSQIGQESIVENKGESVLNQQCKLNLWILRFCFVFEVSEKLPQG